MPLITQTLSNFVRGKLDKSLRGRSSLSVFTSGGEVFRNVLSDLKGTMFFRNGFQFVDDFGEDAVCHEFVFNDDQQYKMLFTDTTIHFYTFAPGGTFGELLDGGSPFTLTNPWTLAQSRKLDFAQNGDTMYIVSPDTLPRKLVRTSATTFTISTYTTTGETFGSTIGFPGAVEFFEGRLWYAKFSDEPITLIGSETGDFDNIDSSSTTTDTAAIKITVSDTKSPLKWLAAGENSLISGTDDGNLVISDGGANQGITRETIEAKLSSSTGASDSQPILSDGNLFYIDTSKRKVKFFKFDILTESFKANDANFLSYDVTRPSIRKLREYNSDTPLILSLRSDGQLVSMFFNEEESVISWHEHETKGEIVDFTVLRTPGNQDALIVLVKRNSSYFIERMDFPVSFPERGDFDTGDREKDDEAYLRVFWEDIKTSIHLDSSVVVEDLRSVEITFDGTDTITASSASFAAGDVGDLIFYKTKTGYESGVFEITGFTSDTEVTVNVLSEPTDLVYDSWYKTFTGVTGLTWLEDMSVAVNADGGDVGDFTVSDGAISLGVPTTKAIVGLRYKGVFKSMPLGIAIGEQGIDTQWHNKKVNRIGVRAVNSAGGLVGTDFYDLAPVQLMPTNLINYLPPPPINETIVVDITDEPSIDRAVYFVQDKPLPFRVLTLFVEADHDPNS